MYVALDKAIRDRLEGNPRDRLGNPVSAANPGVRYPVYNRATSLRDEKFDPFNVIPNQWRMCPIFKRSSHGKDWSMIFPCVVFGYASISPNPEVWLPPVSKNKITTHSGNLVTLRNRAGEVIAVGYPTTIDRPLPEGFNILVQIEVHAKVEYEALALLHGLYTVFPQRGQLLVQQADGSSHSCDMSMLGDTVVSVPEDPSLEDASAAQEDFREHSYIVSYLVEGYQDTTWSYLRQSGVAIQQVSLEMTFPDMPEAVNLTTREGVLEVIDLKTLM